MTMKVEVGLGDGRSSTGVSAPPYHFWCISSTAISLPLLQLSIQFPSMTFIHSCNCLSLSWEHPDKSSH